MPNTIEEEVITEEEEEEEECTYRCRECSDNYLEDNGYNDEFCSSDCHDRFNGEGEYSDDNDDENIPERKWKKGDFPQFQSRNNGEIVKSQRAFSIEVECYYSDVYDVRKVYDNTPDEVGISKDGSLGQKGVEFQSPKLRGDYGEDLVYTLTNELKNRNFRVDKSCGLHVHIDGHGLMPKTRTKDNPQAIKNLLLMYITYEEVIQSILPRSRRNNNYARHVRHSFHRQEIENCHNLELLEKMWYRVAKRKDLKNQKSSHYNTTRYNGLNLHSLFSDGHLEIRYHSGTINGDKILHWVQLHLAMVDYAKRAYQIDSCSDITSLSEKTEKLFNIIGLTETTRDYYRTRQNLFSGDTETREITEETENRN